MYLHYPKCFKQCLNSEKSTSLLTVWAHFIPTATSRTGNWANETKLKGALYTEHCCNNFSHRKKSPKEEDADVSEGWWKHIGLWWQTKKCCCLDTDMFTVWHSVAFLFPEENRNGAKQHRRHQYSVWQTRLGSSLCVTHSYWFTHTHKSKRLAQQKHGSIAVLLKQNAIP